MENRKDKLEELLRESIGWTTPEGRRGIVSGRIFDRALSRDEIELLYQYDLETEKRTRITTKCVICGREVTQLQYAIRDYTGDESYFAWILRHVKHLTSFGFRKYEPFFLPVCTRCVERLTHEE